MLALITAGRQQIEDKTPVHVADLQSMTEEFSRRLRVKPVSHDGDEGGGVSTVGKEVTPLEPEPDTSSRKGMPSCAESASVSASGTSKRVRTQRVLTNVSALGEIHSVDVDGALWFFDDVDSIFMTDVVQYIGNRKHIKNLWTVLSASNGEVLGLQRGELFRTGGYCG